MSTDREQLCDDAVELFKGLLRIDTTNPPGNEREAAELLAERFESAGLEPWIAEPEPDRANLVVRVPATVDDPQQPLLLAGHTDVVPADASKWSHPPFEAVEADGCIWGRGAVDMKNMVAMSAMATIAMSKREHRTRDVIFAAVADEEAGCELGSKWLVDNHPERVRAEYMLGEVGGFWLHIGDQAYLPVMHAEKGQTHLRLRAHGPAGHGSIPRSDNAVVTLARAVSLLGERRLQYRLTDTMRRFLDVVGDTQPWSSRLGLAGLARGWSADYVIDHLLPEPSLAHQFDALLHDTVTPTVLEGSQVRNQIPAEAICDLDGRTIPGVSGGELRKEVEQLLEEHGFDIARETDDVGSDASGLSVELVSDQPGMETDRDTDVMETIHRVIDECDDPVEPVPYMIPGYTDARHYSRLGIECLGFSPLRLPADFDAAFGDLFHGVDERIPVDGFRWGMRRLDEVVSRLAA